MMVYISYYGSIPDNGYFLLVVDQFSIMVNIWLAWFILEFWLLLTLLIHYYDMVYMSDNDSFYNSGLCFFGWFIVYHGIVYIT